MKRLESLIGESEFIITEGAIFERIKREFNVNIDPSILHASLVYAPEGQKALAKVYTEYLDAAKKADLPIMITTPTWRANKERLRQSGFSNKNVNADCFRFLENIRSQYGEYSRKVYIGGLIGCKGDAYEPNKALSKEEAYIFHGCQAQFLAETGVDFLIAQTLPAISEAIGLAMAMAETGKEYIISFVILSNGALLDGTSLNDAIRTIDSLVSPKPLVYMVNCIHPAVLQDALKCNENSTQLVRERLAGIQANTSRLRPEDLDKSDQLITEDPEVFAKSMLVLREENKWLRIFGGCCGTDCRHIEKIIKKFTNQQSNMFLWKNHVLKNLPPAYKKWFVEEKKYLEQNIGKDSKVLDVGCGDGRSILDIISLTQNIVGIDHDQGVIEVVTENFSQYPNIKFLQTDATALPFEDNMFDAVICMTTFANFAGNKIAALQEMRRVIKEKGQIILSVFSEDAFEERMKLYRSMDLNIKRIDGTAVVFDESMGDNISEQFSRKELEDIFKQAKLRVDDIVKVNMAYLCKLKKT